MHDDRDSSTKAPRRILTRRAAFLLVGWSRATGLRREQSDPRVPARVVIGPGRYGFFEDEWAAYVSGLERVRVVRVPDPDASAMARKAAARSVQARRTKAQRDGTRRSVGTK